MLNAILEERTPYVSYNRNYIKLGCSKMFGRLVQRCLACQQGKDTTTKVGFILGLANS